MDAMLSKIRERLALRQDSEHGQALIRILIFSGVIVYLTLCALTQVLSPQVYVESLIMSVMGVSSGALIFLWILQQPGRSDVRRAAGMVVDYGLMCTAMAMKGEPLSWLYVLIMWVTVGNGLRFGSRYLIAAIAMGCVGFAGVIATNAFWQANMSLSVGLWVGLIAIPLYLSGLLKKLTRATAEARRANEAKSRFLANMSHEFRTPLNGLSGMSDLLGTTQLDTEQRECLSTIQASTRSMLALVEDVLDISAIEAGKLRLDESEFSPRELVQHVGFIMQPQARTKHLDYVVNIAEDVPQKVRGDARHLRQILTNLVGNAVKFTERGGVRVHVAMESGVDEATASLTFTVIDTGIGIPARLQARLFDAFEQADVSLSRRYGGTGLGTTIAKGLAEAMGGNIGFESEMGLGSTFWVKLPFKVVDAEPGVVPRGPSVVEAAEETPENVIAFSDPFLRHRARVRSMQILVADDHEANRMVVQRLLQKAGHRINCVGGGEEVLDALEVSDYDAVIIDLHMPGVSGLDLLKQLKVMQAGGGPVTPVIVLSADVTPESISRCEQAGARAFMAKPVVAVRLLDVLAEIAGNAKIIAPMRPQLERQSTQINYDEILDSGVLDELSALGMGEEFEREFIAQCLSDADGCIAAIGESMERRQIDQVRDHAHALKGVSSNLGLSRLAACSGELMRLSDWQASQEWRTRLSVIKSELAHARTALDVRLKNKHQQARENRNESV
ncbi:two-component system, sensor histidine kinase RpfC [Pseudoxanthomonas sp. GM95]|uniref:ATP-binding protein n=1 Tax=Pseudoxanthomonas sp. GM95 TaxID=1881043 RepID=UPI0008CB8BDD|nr:ATP-binding protein [Pseudoxanthomonas sp. GM95]SEL05952.1 two-component system, sensor histidine kinase RpfC [Pseudoxanthomonas sp. GM95]